MKSRDVVHMLLKESVPEGASMLVREGSGEAQLHDQGLTKTYAGRIAAATFSALAHVLQMVSRDFPEDARREDVDQLIGAVKAGLFISDQTLKSQAVTDGTGTIEREQGSQGVQDLVDFDTVVAAGLMKIPAPQGAEEEAEPSLHQRIALIEEMTKTLLEKMLTQAQTIRAELKG